VGGERSSPSPVPAADRSFATAPRSSAHLRELAVALLGANILPGMSTRPRSQAGPPMTLGNTNGVRSLDVSCWLCHHRTIDARPNWQEQPARESLTSAQWR
jgi:hypothetical protein